MLHVALVAVVVEVARTHASGRAILDGARARAQPLGARRDVAGEAMVPDRAALGLAVGVVAVQYRALRHLEFDIGIGCVQAKQLAYL